MNTDRSPIPRSYQGPIPSELVVEHSSIGPWAGCVRILAVALRGGGLAIAGQLHDRTRSFTVEAKWTEPGAVKTQVITCQGLELAQAVAERAIRVLSHPAAPDLFRLRTDCELHR